MVNVSGADLSILAEAAREAAEPTLGGLHVGWFFAASMAVLILIAIWKKVPALVTKGLDKGIADIRHELDEAKRLRAEAEVLAKEYAAKLAAAEKDALAMIEHARHEAQTIVAKAAEDTATLIARRQKMAEEKITAAERGAVDELRLKAADAAARAAAVLIAARHDAGADKALVDQAIAGI